VVHALAFLGHPVAHGETPDISAQELQPTVPGLAELIKFFRGINVNHNPRGSAGVGVGVLRNVFKVDNFVAVRDSGVVEVKDLDDVGLSVGKLILLDKDGHPDLGGASDSPHARNLVPSMSMLLTASRTHLCDSSEVTTSLIKRSLGSKRMRL
jgi:hypothetical protein